MAKKKAYYGVTVDAHLDGEGQANASYVTCACYNGWQGQHKCKHYMGYTTPPEDGETCMFLTAEGKCRNARCMIDALDRMRKLVTEERNELQEQMDYD